MSFRARLFSLHRDLGYFAFGLTVVYAISGLAVNHRHHWNFNQSAQVSQVQVGTPGQLLTSLPEERRRALQADPQLLTRAEEPLLVSALTEALKRPRPPKNAFWRGPDRLSLFFETGDRDTVDYDPAQGTARQLAMTDRPLLRDMNFLHLNERHGNWTWLADGYALVLLFLAFSGIVMTRGRKGLLGRGGVLLGLGLAVPVTAAVVLRYL